MEGASGLKHVWTSESMDVNFNESTKGVDMSMRGCRGCPVRQSCHLCAPLPLQQSVTKRSKGQIVIQRLKLESTMTKYC